MCCLYKQCSNETLQIPEDEDDRGDGDTTLSDLWITTLQETSLGRMNSGETTSVSIKLLEMSRLVSLLQ